MLTEKQSTHRSPMRPVEVSYVSSDATEVPEGYQFNFPVGWTSQQSTNKMIGLRRLKYTPWWGCIGFIVNILNDSDEIISTHSTDLLQFTSSNTLQECLVAIQNIAKWTDSDTGKKYSGIFNYSDQNVTLDFVDEGGLSMKFKLTFDGNNHQYADNLLMLFNQSLNIATRAYVISTIQSEYWMKFVGVWNRQDLYFHSSFSDSTRQLIGVNGDFWQEPSVYYPAALNSNRFTLRFTQDTVTSIIPRHGVLLVQFCLIFNYLKFLD